MEFVEPHLCEDSFFFFKLNLESFQPFISLNTFFCSLFSLFSFWNSQYVYGGMLDGVPQVSEAMYCSVLLFFFCLFHMLFIFFQPYFEFTAYFLKFHFIFILLYPVLFFSICFNVCKMHLYDSLPSRYISLSYI